MSIKPYKIFFLFIVLLCRLPVLLAQDSLQTEAERQQAAEALKEMAYNTENDTNKINLLNRLSRKILEREHGDSRRYAENALRIALKINYNKGIADAYLNFACDYLSKNDYYDALDYFYKTLNIREQLNDTLGIAEVQYFIGKTNFLQNDYQKAQTNYLKALNTYLKFDNLKNIALLYDHIGRLYAETGKLDKALDYYQNALSINRPINNEIALIDNYGNIGKLYQIKDDDRSLNFFVKQLELSEKINNQSGISNASQSIGEYYNSKNNYRKAITYLSRALEIAKKIDSPLQIQSAARELYKAYYSINRYKDAFGFLMLYKEMSDSIFNAKNVKKIAQLQMQYEFDRKQDLLELERQKKETTHKLELLKEKRIRNFFIIAFVVAIIIGLILFWGYKSKQKTVQLIEKQKDKTQIQKQKMVNLGLKIHLLNKEMEQKTKDLEKELKERKRIEKELENSKANLLAIIESTGDYIWSIDTNYASIVSNSNLKDVFEETFQIELKPGTDLKRIKLISDEWRGYYKRALKGEHLLVEKYFSFNEKNGYLEVALNPIITDEDEISGVVVYLRDITERKKSEQALKESERKYRELAEMLPEIVFEADLDGHFTFTNRKAIEITGYNYQEFTKQLTINDLFIPENTARLHSDIDTVIGGGRVTGNEYTLLKKDGTPFPALLYANSIIKENMPVGIRGIVIDITKRKQTELELKRHRNHLEELVVERTQKLSESNALLHSILESPKDISIYSVDNHHRYTSFNEVHRKRVAETSGKQIHLGMNIFETYPSDESKKDMQKDIDKTLSGQAFTQIKQVTVNNTNKYFEFIHNPILDENNTIIGATFFTIDITKRKKAEDALLKERNQLRTLIDNTPDFIYVKDLNSRFLIANYTIAHNMGANSPEELIGKTDYDFYPKEMADKFFSEEQKLFQTGNMLLNIEEKTFDRNKNEIILATTKVPLKDSNNKTIGLVGIGRDITQRKHYELELEQYKNHLEELVKTRTSKLKEGEKKLKALNATKDKFFSIIAHDLRNPFSTLISFSDLLVKRYEYLDKATIMTYLQNILKTSQKGFRLLENLLEWSKSQTGKINRQPQGIDLRNIVNENIDLFSSIANDKNIKLINNIASGINAYADTNMITTVFRNIISNSLKFTNTGGTVKVSAEVNNTTTSPYIKIAVRDNGIGIEEENISRLFKIDENYSTPGTAHEKGSGLGLILCKEFIERNGGSIHVESEIGKGSNFIFTLPLLHKDDKETGKSVATVAADAQDKKKENIIQELIDDVPALREEKNVIEALKEYITTTEKIPGNLVDEINNQLIPMHNQISQVKSINDIKAFAGLIKATGERYHIAPLQKYGERLWLHANSFDIDGIYKTLPVFSKVGELFIEMESKN